MNIYPVSEKKQHRGEPACPPLAGYHSIIQKRRKKMTTHIVLANFTDQGIREIKNTTTRAKAFRELAGKMEVNIKEIYWVLGHYDVVVVLESKKEENVTAFMLKIGSLGNLKSQTLRAFTESEVNTMISQL
ncbi:MAG: GYD domain-containing protein [Candidatus Omnitrophota bacterium]